MCKKKLLGWPWYEVTWDESLLQMYQKHQFFGQTLAESPEPKAWLESVGLQAWLYLHGPGVIYVTTSIVNEVHVDPFL